MYQGQIKRMTSLVEDLDRDYDRAVELLFQLEGEANDLSETTSEDKADEIRRSSRVGGYPGHLRSVGLDNN